MVYKKILIVDDEEETLRLMDKKLTAEGYHVIRAKSAAEALQKAKSLLPDLILMDIMLPDKDGPAAVQILQTEPTIKDIPVIFVSGILSKADSEDVELDLKVAGRSYFAFPKPFTPAALLNKIHEVLGLDH